MAGPGPVTWILPVLPLVPHLESSSFSVLLTPHPHSITITIISTMVGRPHDEFEKNQFLGQELKNFSQAGFDLDRIHIRVSPLLISTRIALMSREMPPSLPSTKRLSLTKAPSSRPMVH